MLSGLIRLMAPFGLNERLRAHQRVPAGPRRLARRNTGWRRSLYRLTRDGARRFERAYRRIYAPRRRGWDGTWELVVARRHRRRHAQRRCATSCAGRRSASSRPASTRDPSDPRAQPPRLSKATASARAILSFRARDDETCSANSLASAVPRAWDLAAVAADYRRFLLRFGAVIDRFRNAGTERHAPSNASSCARS